MKKTFERFFVGFALFCAGTTAVSATTTVSNFPDWWKVSGDPADGVTRTQAHFFHANPNILPSPERVSELPLPEYWLVGHTGSDRLLS